MRQLKYLLVRAAVLAMRLLYAPMKRLKVQNKVVFFSRQSNEPSIDFQLVSSAIARKYPDVRVVIRSRQLKNPVLYILEILIQMYHIATSRAVLLDSYCIPVSVLRHREGLIVIQMWHSIGSMKKFGYAMLGKEEGSDPEIARIMCMHKGYTHILISSYGYLKDYLEGFQTTADQVREIPLPRADILTNKAYLASRRAEIFRKQPWLAAKKNILYCPTFRKQPSELDGQKIRELIDAVDFHKYNLIYKPHSISAMEIHDVRVITSDMNNIDALAIADYMISDYSSIIYEAGLVGVPVFLYGYDWDQYKERREFNLDLQKDVPTLFTDDAKTILEAIRQERFDREAFSDFVRRNCTLPQTSCCEEILKLMKLEETI